MDQLLEEAMDEAASGSSHRRWPLLLLLLVAGGLLAVWLSKRARSVETDVAADVAAVAASEPAATEPVPTT